jgi:hypothetical protein
LFPDAAQLMIDTAKLPYYLKGENMQNNL